jgi:subtilisin family serine protease
MSLRKSLSFFVLVLLLSLAVTIPTRSHGKGRAVHPHRENEMVVRLKPGASLDDFNARHNTQFIKQIPGTDIYLVSTPAQVNDKMSAVAQDRSVAAASRNYITKPAELMQISQGFVDQISQGFVDQISQGFVDQISQGFVDQISQGFVDQISQGFVDQISQGFVDTQLPINYIVQAATVNLHLAETRSLSLGAGVRVAVIDTGIDTSHPLFAGRLAYPMQDFVEGDGFPQDELGGRATGHGTFVSGLITLTAPQAMIMPLRAFGNDGAGTSFDIASAIYFAANNGAQVINMSFGFAETDPLIQEALNYAASRCYLVAAAGNDNENFVHYPASNSSLTLSVTSTGAKDMKAPFANFHSSIEVAAPGVYLFSAYPGNRWGWWSGTSFSTPLVAGEAALLLSVRSNLSRKELDTIITKSGVNINRRNPDYAGQLGVRIDFQAALSQALSY